MLYAVVDIETTGGRPANSRITEICVVVTDGKQVVSEFETLLNPGCAVPRGITALTGIDDAMLKDAPVFADIAGELHHLLHDKVFVAHNVNFDFTFILKEFETLGIPFSPPRICSARTARKAFPGKRSYSLGSICAALGIEITNRHRAGGDARATAELFHRIATVLGTDTIEGLAGRNMRKMQLPPGIDAADIDKLPSEPGVYYFLNASGKPLYVGKAINIQKRVLQHFDPERGKTPLQLEQIASIDFEETGSEFMALLVEAEAIARLWPAWNKAGKLPANRYAIVSYPTIHGELRIQAIRKARNTPSGIGFPRLSDARNSLAKLIREHGICSSLAHSSKPCFDESCYCQQPLPLRLNTHNEKINNALLSLDHSDNELLILCRGRHEGETGVIHMFNGAVAGWGFAEHIPSNPDPEILVSRVKDLAETRAIANAFLRRIVSGSLFGYRVIPINQGYTLPETPSLAAEPEVPYQPLLPNNSSHAESTLQTEQDALSSESPAAESAAAESAASEGGEMESQPIPPSEITTSNQVNEAKQEVVTDLPATKDKDHKGTKRGKTVATKGQKDQSRKKQHAD